MGKNSREPIPVQQAYPTLTEEQSLFVEVLIRNAFKISPTIAYLSENCDITIPYGRGKYWIENGETKIIIEEARKSAQNTAIQQVKQVAQQVTQTMFLSGGQHKKLVDEIIHESLLGIKEGVSRSRAIISGSADREPGTDRNAIDAIRAMTGALESVAELFGVKQQIVQSATESTIKTNDGASIDLLRSALLGTLTGEQPAIPAAQQSVVEIQAQHESDPLSYPVQPSEPEDYS
jgi:hypothetical protein